MAIDVSLYGRQGHIAIDDYRTFLNRTKQVTSVDWEEHSVITVVVDTGVTRLVVCFPIRW